MDEGGVQSRTRIAIVALVYVYRQAGTYAPRSDKPFDNVLMFVQNMKCTVSTTLFFSLRLEICVLCESPEPDGSKYTLVE